MSLLIRVLLVLSLCCLHCCWHCVLQDRIILTDSTFLPILGRIWKQLPLLEAVVVLTDRCGWGRTCGSNARVR